jgi:sigma-E factor negative regulatory protein RseC
MRGRILEVTGNLVTIEPDRPAACFGCMQSGCRRGTAPIRAKNTLNQDLLPGHLVEAALPPHLLLTQAAAALLPPLAGFIAGYTLAARALPPADAPRAAAGALLMLLAALGFYLFRRRFPPKTLLQITNYW